MAMKQSSAKKAFAAFGSIGNQEDRRNGNVLGRPADTLYSGNAFTEELGAADTTEKQAVTSTAPASEEKAVEVKHMETEIKATTKAVTEATKPEMTPPPAVTSQTPPAEESEPAESFSAKEKKSMTKSSKPTAPVVKKKRGRPEKENKKSTTIENFYCGSRIFDNITENSYIERKSKVEYLNDLIRRELALYEKDKEGYIESRRKKVESLKKLEKGDRKAVQFHLEEDLALFLEDVHFDVRTTKSQLFCAIAELDTERIERKRKNGK